VELARSRLAQAYDLPAVVDGCGTEECAQIEVDYFAFFPQDGVALARSRVAQAYDLPAVVDPEGSTEGSAKGA
jgi:hypothetical protein